MDMFHRYVAMEALHDSGERFAEPACHPGTRIGVLEELASWSTDTGCESTLLWLHGAAGVGKSAIAQMFTGNCQSEGKLGAAFFFGRGHPRRGTWNRLIPTIAYQLATSIPEFRLPLEEIIESDKLICSFRRLLVDPFRVAPNLPLKPVIILEGLDECEDHKVQQQIIRLFVRAIRDGQLPVRILITSRPEPHLREILETDAARAISRQFALSADHAAYEDIRTYLQDEFTRIRSESIARGMDLVATWPATHTLDHLVAKSSAIFVYATTVVLFIEDEYSHPADQLESVLKLDPESTAPLDDLYTQIVSSRLRPEPHNLRILHEIWRGGMARVRSLNPEEIDLVLELRRGDCRLALRGLHALLHVPPARTGPGVCPGVAFLHASFQDFLWDQRRSGRWCVATRWLQCGNPNLLAYKFP
ncbi:hypothetical protein B0H11DRAFT_2123007 [Mycena galericulata]|nr:hypothetical protein B0H11DRAFT_2134362 [Mycena galericulata]KAJ7433100.1 hypothetical protein B0H11DRAFT_2123007 [Mycena galericulata]